MNTWRDDYRQQKSLRHGKSTVVHGNSKQKEEDVIDYVSPYTIINDTGYPIEVEAEKPPVPVAPSANGAPQKTFPEKEFNFEG